MVNVPQVLLLITLFDYLLIFVLGITPVLGHYVCLYCIGNYYVFMEHWQKSFACADLVWGHVLTLQT
jgi:hypothetical protein